MSEELKRDVNANMDDVNDQVDQQEAEEFDMDDLILEPTAGQEIKNGVASIGRGIKKGAKKHWKKIVAIGAGVAAAAVVIGKAYSEGKASAEIDALPEEETPLLDATDEPEDQYKDLYLVNEATGDFTYIKTVDSGEAEDLIESLTSTDTTEEVVSTEAATE